MIYRTLCVAAGFAGVLLAQAQLDPVLLGKPPVDAWPTYHGDYSGRHFSTLDQIQSSQRKEPWSGLGLPRGHECPGRRDRRNCSRSASDPPGPRCVGWRPAQIDAVVGERCPLLFGAGSRLGSGRAHREGDLAFFLENQRRRSHRQPRIGDVRPLVVPGNTGRLHRIAGGRNR